MAKSDFYEYAQKFGKYQKRSMFGGVGLFIEEAMYALIINESIFLRGGGKLDRDLRNLGCSKFCHIKKRTTVTVNYYDISKLYQEYSHDLNGLIIRSINTSIGYRQYQKSSKSKRLRDLPNMRLTLERMVIKSGVPDVQDFMALGAVEVFRMVQRQYGKDVDINLLWKFAGAIDGVHWELLGDTTKSMLEQSYNSA